MPHRILAAGHKLAVHLLEEHPGVAMNGQVGLDRRLIQFGGIDVDLHLVGVTRECLPVVADLSDR